MVSDDEVEYENEEESQYVSIVQKWSLHRGDGAAHLIEESIDDDSMIIELWGNRLEVYVPQDAESNFFVTTESEDARLNSCLIELNDMPHLRTLQDFLDKADELLSGSSNGPFPCLTRADSNPKDDHVFADTQILKRNKSAEVLSLEKLEKVQQDLVANAARNLQLDETMVSLLLIHLKWDDEALLRRFPMEREALLVAAGAALPPDRCYDNSQLCCVCFADAPVAKLACGHGLCQDDWPAFLKCNLDSGTVGGENCLRLRCPGERCPLTVTSDLFQRFLEPVDHQRFSRLRVLSFVNDNDRIVWCPRDGCEYCVAFSRRRSTVTCTCGHVFCFSCQLPAHAPAKCSNAKAWLAKEEEMAGLAKCKNAVLDTKPCPNPDCRVLAHKMTGCHYLCCPQCKEHWCWQCGDWGGGPSGRREPHHVSDCNNPVNKDWYKSAAAVDVFDNEGKYWFYCERYKNHLNSHGFASDLRDKLKTIVKDIEEDASFRIQDIQLVDDATELLIECRLVLAWTYVWAFFQQNEAQRQLFEFVQKDLENKTEQLSGMIENQPTHEILKDRTRLLDYVAALRDYLDNIKQYTTIDSVEDTTKITRNGKLEENSTQGYSKAKPKSTKKQKIPRRIRNW